MAFPNPPSDVYESNLTSAEVPHFAPPTTPSRSPFRETLHVRRSPAKAIRSTRTLPDLEEFQKLLDNEGTTAGEKDLASRVVKAAEKLREWCFEIEQWGWSGSFDIPAPDSNHSSVHNNNFSNPYDALDYCGSLPRIQAETYEHRLDEIDEELAAFEVDELKEHVLGIHVGRSRPSSSYSSQSLSTFTIMDDFQLFVTETLMQTLPYHVKLRHYQRAWSTRLAVLMEVPLFLAGMKSLGSQINRAYHTLQYPIGPEMPASMMYTLHEKLETERDALKDKLSELGKVLDNMLDMLEGQDDKLPGGWIDKYEEDEKEIMDWTYHADKMLFQLRMLVEGLTLDGDSQALFESEVSKEQIHETKSPKSPAAEVPEPDVAASLVPADRTESSEILRNGQSMKSPELLVTTYSPDESTELAKSSAVAVAVAVEPEQSKHAVESMENHSQATAIQNCLPLLDSGASSSLVDSLVENQEGNTVVMSPRNSISTVSSQHRPSSPSKDSSVPPSPTDASMRPTSWDTQASSPQSTMKAGSPASSEKAKDVRPYTPDPETPSHRRNSISSVISTATSEGSNRTDIPEVSPSLRRASFRQAAKAPRPQLNFSMRKRRGETASSINPSRTFSTPFSDIENLSAIPPPGPPAKMSNISPKSPSVPLEQQISNILDSIPAPIRLTTGSSPEKPKPKRTSSSQQSRNRASTPTSSPLPTITLAPADEVTARKAGANDPEIKLYHLSQPGKDKPIKLFVRRVGENGERVMVRVGGGWADLGEYLRGYAEHHGRRTTSDGRVEVLGLGNDPPTSAAATPGSRRTSFISSLGSSAIAGTATSTSRTSSPTPPLAINTVTPRVATEAMTPLSTSTQSPAFGSANSRRSLSASWESADISLAGPAQAIRAAKKGDMSEEKQQWIEGIVEQAKASVPGRKVEFGELGKKGGTRRVFLKGGKGGGGVE